MRAGFYAFWMSSAFLIWSGADRVIAGAPEGQKIRIIVDSDANNELDDQHAIAYVLLNPSIFQVEGITVNKTFGGGDINMQAAEAERVVTLCGLSQTVRVYKGATGDFDAIRDSVTRSQFDGSDAVNFIIDRAKAPGGRLVILAIGKLTNVGLAVRKDPSIAGNVRLVWLGTNYPDPGEYNFENDTSVVKFLLRSNLEFEVAVVRYGKPSGTAAVQVSVDDIRSHMRGKGPHIPRKIPGRNGGEFECFGDYSIDLFEHVKEQYRSLYDMAAAAIVKNPQWAHKLVIPAPKFENGRWADQPSNPRQVVLWENFSRDPIVEDLFRTMNQK